MSVFKYKMFGFKLQFEEHPYQAMLKGDTVTIYNPKYKRWETTTAKEDSQNVWIELEKNLSPDQATQLICEALDRLEGLPEVVVCYSFHKTSRRDPEENQKINIGLWINPLKKAKPIDFPWCPHVITRRDGMSTYELLKRTMSFR